MGRLGGGALVVVGFLAFMAAGALLWIGAAVGAVKALGWVWGLLAAGAVVAFPQLAFKVLLGAVAGVLAPVSGGRAGWLTAVPVLAVVVGFPLARALLASCWSAYALGWTDVFPTEFPFLSAGWWLAVGAAYGVLGAFLTLAQIAEGRRGA